MKPETLSKGPLYEFALKASANTEQEKMSKHHGDYQNCLDQD